MVGGGKVAVGSGVWVGRGVCVGAGVDGTATASGEGVEMVTAGGGSTGMAGLTAVSAAPAPHPTNNNVTNTITLRKTNNLPNLSISNPPISNP